MRVAVLTHPGQHRAENQDRVVVDGVVLGSRDAAAVEFDVGPDALVAVVDGMGGHPAGGVAAAIVADVIASGHRRLRSASDVRALVCEANDEVYAMMGRVPELSGMGACIAGVAVNPHELVIFNVGDARVYVQASGYLMQASVDDRHAGAADGAISQSLGGLRFHAPVDVHISCEPPHGGRVLVASDGVFAHGSHHDLEQAMDRPLVATVEALVESALRAGGHDNISLALLELAETDP